MAGIGVRLSRIFGKETIATNLLGFGYSAMVTIAPMFVIIGNVILMGNVLGYDSTSYARRGLLYFRCFQRHLLMRCSQGTCQM